MYQDQHCKKILFIYFKKMQLYNLELINNEKIEKFYLKNSNFLVNLSILLVLCVEK